MSCCTREISIYPPICCTRTAHAAPLGLQYCTLEGCWVYVGMENWMKTGVWVVGVGESLSKMASSR